MAKTAKVDPRILTLSVLAAAEESSYTLTAKDLMAQTGLSAQEIKPVVKKGIADGEMWMEGNNVGLTQDGLNIALEGAEAQEEVAEDDPFGEDAAELEVDYEDEEVVQAPPTRAAKGAVKPAAGGKTAPAAGKKPATPAQLAAREKFAEQARERAAAKKAGKAAPAARATKATTPTKQAQDAEPFRMEYDAVTEMSEEDLTDRMNAGYKYAQALFGDGKNYEAACAAELCLRGARLMRKQLAKRPEA